MRILDFAAAAATSLLLAGCLQSGNADAPPYDQALLDLGAADAAPMLAFEPNLGQAGADVRFVSRGEGFALLLTDTGAMLRRAGSEATITLAGAGPRHVAPIGRLPGASHYFLGNDPDRWLRAVPRFAEARFTAVHEGVDLAWRGREGRVELGFTLAPGTRLEGLVLEVAGIGEPMLDAGGNVWWLPATDALVLQRPIAYQEVAGARRSVESSYQVLDGDAVGISLGHHDPALPLVVVPVLAHRAGRAATESGAGEPIGAEADATGVPWEVGSTLSVAGDDTDAYVCRGGPTDTASECAFLGGSGEDAALSLAMGPDGGVHVAGSTQSPDFPLVAAHQPSLAGERDAFVVRMDAAFDGPVFSTYLGGAGDDLAHGMAVDAGGAVYVTGDTTSRAFPVTAGALQEADPTGCDAFVAKFDGGGTLAFATYLGGSAADAGRHVTLDADGHVYVSGRTESRDFPSLAPAGDAPVAEGTAFLATLHHAGDSLVDRTYLVGGADPRPR